MKILTRAAAGSALLATTVSCASCSSSGAADSTPARIPAHAGVISALPAACSLVSAATLKALDLQAKGMEQPTAQRGGVLEKTCIWGASAQAGGRSLTVVADLFPAADGQTSVAAAENQFQQNTSDQAQADGDRGHAVSGLANQAFVDQVTRSRLSQVQVVARDQNVLATIAYSSLGTSGGPSVVARAGGALTAARAVLSALTAS